MRQATKGIVLAQGIPDAGQAPAFINAQGKPGIQFPGQMQLLPETLRAFDLQRQRYWFPSEPIVPAGGLRGIVNLCCDPWAYRKSLHSLQSWSKQQVPVFNNPAAVVRAHDTSFLNTLSKIDGLKVPRRLTLIPRKPEDFRKATKKAGLRYPVKLQEAAGVTTGGGHVIKSERNWQISSTLQWPGKAFVISEIPKEQFTAHTRWRVCFVGREAEVVSFSYGYGPSGSIPSGGTQLTNLPPNLQGVSGAILGAVGLDHWTMELSQSKNNDLRLEHLWAGLPDWSRDNPDDASSRLWSKLSAKVHSLLLAPESWRTAKAGKMRGVV